jgi:hypothetical protein
VPPTGAPIGFPCGGNGNDRAVREILIASAFLSLAGVLAYIGLLLWAAREDGRDQQRRDWLRGR